MGFGERAASRKRARDMKSELKQLRKELLLAGCDKSSIGISVKEFGEALELADALETEYVVSRTHLNGAREAIMKLLDCMGESPKEEVNASLVALLGDLDRVYHDCSIREDDLDFKSTMKSLKEMVAAKGKQEPQGQNKMSSIMLRSELENIKAVLDDAAGWKAPDFLALAYYFLHEDKDSVRDMENVQRNTYVLSYFSEHFMEQFQQECQRAGQLEKLKELEQSYVYEPISIK